MPILSMSFWCSSATSSGNSTDLPPMVTVEAAPAACDHSSAVRVSIESGRTQFTVMAQWWAERYSNSWSPRLSQAVPCTGAMMGMGTMTAGM